MAGYKDPPKHTQFKKGESGNPNGRPKKLPNLDEILSDVLSEEQNGISAAQAIIMKLRNQAIGGDKKAAQMLLDRGYGLPKQKLDITSEGDKLTQSLIIIEKPTLPDEPTGDPD